MNPSLSRTKGVDQMETIRWGQSDEDEPDFEPRTEAAVPLQPVSKKICWNKVGENKLRGTYGKG